MVEFASQPAGMSHKHIAGYAAAVVLCGAFGVYAIHEHHVSQNLAANNVETTAALNTTQHQLSDLAAKVNSLASREAQAAQPIPPTQNASTQLGRPSPTHRLREDPRYKKLQSLVDAQGKAIDQTRTDLASKQVLVLLIAYQLVEDPLPHARMGPAHKTLMHALVFAVAFRQVAPPRSAAQNPQHPIDEVAVISRGAAHMLLAPGKEIPDPLPLRFVQLVSARHTSTSAANHLAAKCICRYGLG